MMKNNERCEYDPKKIFDDGNAFWLAAGRCQESREKSNGEFDFLAVPTIVSLSFSAELFIKSLLQKRGLLHEREGHDLKKLFQKLPDEIKNDVMEGKDEDSFMKILEPHALTFQHWRYFYESEKLSASLCFLKEFADKLRTIAIRELDIKKDE